MNINLYVLLIDDNPIEASFLAAAFEDMGRQIMLAWEDDGHAALQRLEADAKQENLPHLVILDLSMLKHTGIEVLREIRRNRLLDDVPVVVHSSTDDPRERALCTAAGATDFIQKGLTFAELRRAAQELLNHSRSADSEKDPSPPWSQATST